MRVESDVALVARGGEGPDGKLEAFRHCRVCNGGFGGGMVVWGFKGSAAVRTAMMAERFLR